MMDNDQLIVVLCFSGSLVWGDGVRRSDWERNLMAE